MNNYIMQINNLSLYFKDKNILNNLNFDIKKGEIIGLKGISGSGKSTLLKAISGVIPNLITANMSGNIFLENTDISTFELNELTKKIGIVFQDPQTQLFLSTVEDEVAFGIENLCLPFDILHTRINEVLTLVEMSEFKHHNPSKLSGGQQQLIVLASVLAMKPQLLLLDEALSQVDNAKKNKILENLKKYTINGNSILIIDHNEDNLKICDRILVLENKTIT